MRRGLENVNEAKDSRITFLREASFDSTRSFFYILLASEL